MVGEDVPAAVAFEVLVHDAWQMQLLLQPQWKRLAERAIAGGDKGEIGFEQAFELADGLVVEAHVINVSRCETGIVEAEVDRVFREAVIVLLSSEPFLPARQRRPRHRQPGRRPNRGRTPRYQGLLSFLSRTLREDMVVDVSGFRRRPGHGCRRWLAIYRMGGGSSVATRFRPETNRANASPTTR